MNAHNTHNVKWKVTLSNREVLTEGSGSFKEIEGEASPWQRLLKYLSTSGLSITGLVLVAGKRKYILQNSKDYPNFERFRYQEIPLNYRCERAIARELNEGEITKEWYTIGVAEYEYYDVELWVSEFNTDKIYTLVTFKEPK